MTQTLSQLENRGAFIERHIWPDAQQQQEMLKTVGADSLNALIGQIVPKDIQLATPPQVGEATTEFAELAELKAIAGLNKRYKSYIGMGYTNVQLPPVILRNMLENPGWYTALYPVSAGSVPGPSGSAAELPAGDARPDRDGYRFRLVAG
jgi:glycine dehydrogenase